MLKNFHYNWRKTLKLSPKALWHNFGANTFSKLSPQKIVLILPPDRFQDKILESPQCRHVRLCMSRVPWKHLLQSSLLTYFTQKWNSIGNHEYGDSNPPHNDFSSFAALHPWSMTKYENSPLPETLPHCIVHFLLNSVHLHGNHRRKGKTCLRQWLWCAENELSWSCFINYRQREGRFGIVRSIRP